MMMMMALPPAGRCYQRHDIKEYIQIKPPRDGLRDLGRTVTQAVTVTLKGSCQ
jgi:hypothetical protein